MKKLVLIVAVAVAALLADGQLASAGRCGGGRGGCGGRRSHCHARRGHCKASKGCKQCCPKCAPSPCGAAPRRTCALQGGAGVAEASGNEATVVVNLPADASLTIDEQPTTSTSGDRVFVTPALEPDMEYQYTFKAQIVRDGQTQTVTRQVTVRAGEVSHVELAIPAAGVAAQ